ncbi:hypothetical protein D1614_09200 [Maribellus luteus]|uniref:Uncharacterized protein n=1 Tax=Maribellus luteus TaxID=2305463 RepID=A0A399T126_9BACT|nr:hypothetical protein [Maribellus luteus]RIJ48699.1 hypothetical protein D1614_09200 [Maribellus luteus]
MNLLLIDNEDLTESISDINDLAVKKSIPIKCYPLHVGLPDGNDVIDENGKISLQLVRDKLDRLYGNRRFHMVASDFKLNDEEIDGVAIIRQLNGISNTRKAAKILYSAELDEIVQGYLEIYKKDGDFDRSWRDFKALITLNILDFVIRDKIEECIINLIGKNGDNGDDYIVDELLSHSDLSFNPSLEIYEGMTLGEIADQLVNNDSQSHKFKRKLIQLAVADLVNLNNE